MVLLFSLIARTTTILALYSSVPGNLEQFKKLSGQILTSIENSEDNSKNSYLYGQYLITYVKEENVAYLCFADDEFRRDKAFLFLGEVKTIFEFTYGKSRIENAHEYEMNKEFAPVLKIKMEQYSIGFDDDSIHSI